MKVLKCGAGEGWRRSVGPIEVTRRRGRRRKKLLDDLETGEDTFIGRRRL